MHSSSRAESVRSRSKIGASDVLAGRIADYPGICGLFDELAVMALEIPQVRFPRQPARPVITKDPIDFGSAFLDRRHVVVEVGGGQHGEPEISKLNILGDIGTRKNGMRFDPLKQLISLANFTYPPRLNFTKNGADSQFFLIHPRPYRSPD